MTYSNTCLPSACTPSYPLPISFVYPSGCWSRKTLLVSFGAPFLSPSDGKTKSLIKSGKSRIEHPDAKQYPEKAFGKCRRRNFLRD